MEIISRVSFSSAEGCALARRVGFCSGDLVEMKEDFSVRYRRAAMDWTAADEKCIDFTRGSP